TVRNRTDHAEPELTSRPFEVKRRPMRSGSGPSVGDNRAMQIAIVGLAGSGKTTVFNTLTRGHAETGGFGGMELHVGVVKVPDDRLDKLAAIFKPKKVIQADVTYVDLPFEDPNNPHPEGSVDPARDIDRLDTEFILADLALVERRLERLKQSG